MKCSAAIVALSAIVLNATAARAGDVNYLSPDSDIAFTGSYGLTSIKANEFVWEGKTKVSQLIWKSQNVSTFNADLKIELPKDWYVNARGTIGLGGDGHMVDYDWLAAGQPWSDRSRHPDTRLNHYLVGAIEAGRQVISQYGTDVSLGAGFKYTDVKWTAWGGTYVYTYNGFRDSRGTFDPKEKGISYRQSWPVPYIGANLSHSEGNWTFAGALQGGLAIDAYGTDDHWVRSLRFYDYFYTQPTVSLSASAAYALRPGTALFVSGAFDRMFRARADTKAVETTNGATEWYKNGAGGDYRSMTVSVGLRGTF
jgi:outer membrane protease